MAARNKGLLAGAAAVALTLGGVGYMLQLRRKDEANRPVVRERACRWVREMATDEAGGDDRGSWPG